MASIGHVAVGLLIGRAYEARTVRERVVTMSLFGGLGLAPDADAALVALGAEYTSHYGHRGFTHSILFAGALSAIAYLLARRFGTRPLFTALLTFLAVSSHGFLDAMTYRTRGIPFLWPFSEERFTLPWRMIPPAPFGGNFISRRGLDVMLIEMFYFLPLTVVALGPSLRAVRGWYDRTRAFAHRIAARFSPMPAPAFALARVAGPRPFTPARALARLVFIGFVLGGSLVTAELALRDSALVARLESTHQKEIAVSLSRKPQFNHFH